MFRRNMSPPTLGSSNKPTWKQVASRALRYVPPKRRLTFNGLHGVITQEIELFITTGVRTSNPTPWFLFRPVLSSLLPELMFLRKVDGPSIAVHIYIHSYPTFLPKWKKLGLWHNHAVCRCVPHFKFGSVDIFLWNLAWTLCHQTPSKCRRF
jgi:hypothetical protein